MTVLHPNMSTRASHPFQWLTSLFGSGNKTPNESFSYKVDDGDGQGETNSIIVGDAEDETELAERDFEVLVQAYMRDNHYQSRNQAVANIMYGTLNAGFVALPYACYMVGVPLFVFCVIIVACIAGYTTQFVIKLAGDQGVVAGRGSIPRTLEDLSEVAYGFKGYCLVATMQISLSVTFMCLSLEVWGEILSSILTCRLKNVELNSTLRWLLTDRNGGVLIGAGVVLPLVIKSSTVSSLRWTSYTTIICIASAFVSVVAAFIQSDNNIAQPTPDVTPILGDLTNIKAQWWVVCLIVTLCFSYNQKAFSVYSSLRRRSSERWGYAVKRANIWIVCLYSLFGSLGYLAHIQKLQRFNFFLDFDGENSFLFDCTRGIVAFGLLLAYPMDTLVASTTARRLWRRLRRRQTIRTVEQRQSEYPEVSDDDLLSSLRDTAEDQLTAGCLIASEHNKSAVSEISLNNDVTDGSLSVGSSGISTGTPDDNTYQHAFSKNESILTSNASMKTESFNYQPESQLADDTEDDIIGRCYTESIENNDFIRNSSVGDRPQEKNTAECLGMRFASSLPVMLMFWVVGLSIAISVDAGVVMAATIGGISTSIMVFILPSMLYFKLGLTSDYQESPLIGTVVSNRLYMSITQIIGVIFFLGNIGFIIYWLTSPEVSFNNVIAKTGN